MNDSPAKPGLQRSRLPVLATLLVVIALSGRWIQLERLDWATPEDTLIESTAEIEGRLVAATADLYRPPPIDSMWRFRVSFLAPEGKQVEPGDLLVSFDATQLTMELRRLRNERDEVLASIERTGVGTELEVADAELRLAQAKAALTKAAMGLEVPVHLVGSHELEAWRIEHRQAERSLARHEAILGAIKARGEATLRGLSYRAQQATAGVAAAEAAIESMAVKARSKGLLIYAEHWGEKVSVGGDVSKMRSVVEIPDLSTLYVDAFIDEAAIDAIELDQPLELELDASPGRMFPGRIQTIGSTVTERDRRDRRRAIRVAIELDSIDTELMRPGMRIRARVAVARTRVALSLPRAAVGENGRVVIRHLLWTEEMSVETGLVDEQRIQVIGLEPGQRVLLSEASS